MSAAQAPLLSGWLRANVFQLNAIRLALAVLVLVSHTWVLGGYGAELDWPTFGPHMSLGRFALGGFFALSGMLVTMSVTRRSARSFVRARFVRIHPAYFVVLVAAAVLRDRARSHPPRPVLRASGPARRRLTPRRRAPDRHRCPARDRTQRRVLRTLPSTGLHLLFAFLAGAVLGLLADRIRFTPRLWAGAILAFLATSLVGGRVFAAIGLGSLALILPLLAGALPRRGFGIFRNDLSYGVYICAFAVQQTLASTGLINQSVWLYLAVTLAITFVLAAASWFLVERPALRWKDRGRSPVPSAPASG